MSHTLDELEGWLQAPLESEHLEFKEAKRSFDVEKLLDYCVALANEGGGKLILGVSDALPRRVVGSSAFTSVQSIRERVYSSLRRRINVVELMHRDGRVLVFDVPSRPIGMPLERDGRYLMRVGEQLVPMTAERIQSIFAEAEPDFSGGVIEGVELAAIDQQSLDQFRALWTHRAANPALASMSVEQLLSDAGLLLDGRLTRAALVLLGSPEALQRHLGHAEVVFEYRSSDGSVAYQQRIEFKRGFFAWYDELWRIIDLRNDRQMVLSGLFRIEVPTFDEGVVREALLNAISHRDYRLGGSVFIRQYPRRLEIVSPGGFPAGVTPENVLDRQVPRNRCIAEVLARCKLVERSGQGMNRIYEGLVRQSKPLPDFAGTDAYQVSITLSGEIQNPDFVRFLDKLGAERLESFTTRDYLVLDLVQREEPVPDALRLHITRLLNLGVIERVGRRLLLSRALHAHLGQRGTYTRRKGLDHETNKALLLKHIRENSAEGSPLADLVQVLPHVGYGKVRRLLQELKSKGVAFPRGQRRHARWFPSSVGLPES